MKKSELEKFEKELQEFVFKNLNEEEIICYKKNLDRHIGKIRVFSGVNEYLIHVFGGHDLAFGYTTDTDKVKKIVLERVKFILQYQIDLGWWD